MFVFATTFFLTMFLLLHRHFQARSLSIHTRFYTSLALNDLVNEVPLMAVSAKFGASKGMLQVSGGFRFSDVWKSSSDLHFCFTNIFIS